MDDHILVDTLRVHSPTSIGSSFVLVSDEDEVSTRTPSKSRDHTPCGSHDQPSREELEKVVSQLKTSSAGGEESSEKAVESVEDKSFEVQPIIPVKLSPGEAEVGGGVSELSEGRSSELVRAGGPTPDNLAWGASRLGETAPEDDVADSEDAYLCQLSLSESTVLVEGEESKYLKSNNRELRRKVRKLTSKLEAKEREVEHTAKVLGEVEVSNVLLCDKVANLEGEKSELEGQLQASVAEKERLSVEMRSLGEKVTKLENECATVSEHSSRVLREMEACETKLQVERSGRAVLEEKLARTEKELEKIKLKLASEKRRDHEEQRRKEVKYRPTDLPLASSSSHEKALAAAPRHKPHPTSQSSDKERHRHKHVHGTKERTEAAASSSHRAKLTAESQASKVPVVSGRKDEGTNSGQKREDGREGEARSRQRREDEKKVEYGGRRRGEGRGDEGWVGERREEGKGEELSEGRITDKLTGNATLFVCPVCGKQLPARETEYSATLHVEHCLSLQGN